VRDLAETVDYAHGRRLFHRALSPRSVLVLRPGTPEQRFSIVNWQTGARTSGETLSTTVEGTRHPEQLVEEQSAAYLAPEALTQPGADAELLDVFSLGAIAFHVFTGSPPASTLAGLASVLERDGALEVSSRLDGAGTNLTELIRMTTAADASQRLPSVADFLALLDTVEDELTAPDEATDEGVPPEKAGKGDVLAGYAVERRLGRGSTAIAFLVHDAANQQRVLKVASDPDRNDRLRDEGEVLDKLRDRTIVASYGEPVDVVGHTGLVLAYASEGTLLQWLRREGRLGLETLERWGEDLLSAVSYLEQVGIPHRDVKPENLGIMELGPPTSYTRARRPTSTRSWEQGSASAGTSPPTASRRPWSCTRWRRGHRRGGPTDAAIPASSTRRPRSTATVFRGRSRGRWQTSSSSGCVATPTSASTRRTTCCARGDSYSSSWRSPEPSSRATMRRPLPNAAPPPWKPPWSLSASARERPTPSSA
jgi:serine/threonine protein kinase